MTRPALEITALETARLELAPLDPARDVADLLVGDADPRMHVYDHHEAGPADVAAERAALERELAANGGASWAIRLRGEPTALGRIGVFADQGTTIRGVGWSLTPTYWQRGIMGEAARTVVPYLLGRPGVDGLEAWVDSRNAASLGVARAAGMREVARLPRSGPRAIGQTVVMAIAAVPADPDVHTVTPRLAVRDVAASVALLEALGLHEAWSHGDPPAIAELAVARWSGSAGVQVVRQDGGDIAPGEVTLELGVWVDDVYAAALRAGFADVEAPGDRPWGRRDATVALPEGHRIGLSGATTPGT